MHRVVSDYTRNETSNSNIKVYVRARPILDKTELTDFISRDSNDERKIIIKDPDVSNKKYSEVSFQFDKLFWTNSTQEDIFNSISKPQVDRVLSGYNCCCFAYGQTGSGKTYSMFGGDSEIRGIIPRSVEYMFECLRSQSTKYEVAMVCSFLEIYNDQIRDLGKAYLAAMGVDISNPTTLNEKTSDIVEKLANKRGNSYFAPLFQRDRAVAASSAEIMPGLKEVYDGYNTMNYDIREDSEGNVFVKDLSLIPVTTMEEVMTVISMGLRVRATHETKMNQTSSRSHTIFTINVIQRDKLTGQAISGMLNLVDLAGSERLKKSESQGVRLKEALHINSSLTSLGKVIMALDPTNTDMPHIPYRESKLTRILQNSLGGNSYTTVLATIQPLPAYYDECLSTLQFANRCRNVHNIPKVNYIIDNEDKDRKIKRLLDEINGLKNKVIQLENNNVYNSTNNNQFNHRINIVKLYHFLKNLGINVTLSADQTYILYNNKKLNIDDLYDDNSTVSDNQTINSSNYNNININNLNMKNNEKLKSIINELQEYNIKVNRKLSDKKVLLEEQGKQLQLLNDEIIKLKLLLKHKDYDMNNQNNIYNNNINELKTSLSNEYKSNLQILLNNNSNIIDSTNQVIRNIPININEYSKKVNNIINESSNNINEMKSNCNNLINHLNIKYNDNITLITSQYNYYINQKNVLLSNYIEKYNHSIDKLKNKLFVCNKDIITLCIHVDKVEKILNDIENGNYYVKPYGKTNSRGQFISTNNIKSLLTNSMKNLHTYIDSNIVDSNIDNQLDNNEDDHYINKLINIQTNSTNFNLSIGMGKILLPDGLRPSNPLRDESNELEYSKKLYKYNKNITSYINKFKTNTLDKVINSNKNIISNDPILFQQLNELVDSNKINRPKSALTNKSSNLSTNRSRPATAINKAINKSNQSYDSQLNELNDNNQLEDLKLIIKRLENENDDLKIKLNQDKNSQNSSESLRKQLQDMTNNFNNIKIVNSSLQRKLDKQNQIKS